jgi:hypothetical protein
MLKNVDRLVSLGSVIDVRVAISTARGDVAMKLAIRPVTVLVKIRKSIRV